MTIDPAPMGQQVVSDHLGERLARFARATEIRDGLVKVALLSNSGGALAVVGIVGGIMARSANGTFPSAFFWVLSVFLIGLVAAYLADLRRYSAARLASKIGVDDPVTGKYAGHGIDSHDRGTMELDELEMVYHKQKLELRLIVVSMAAFIFGASAGLIALWQRTG
jgi:hypothetical protein